MRQTVCEYCKGVYYFQYAQDRKERELVSRKFDEHLKNHPACSMRQRILENLFYNIMTSQELDPALLPRI
jgi:hypothetical protein